jgi:phage shock protein A
MNLLLELVQAWMETADWERTARWALKQLEELRERVEGLVEAHEQKVDHLMTSLGDANRAWSRAKSQLRMSEADRLSLVELNRKLESDADKALAELTEVEADRDGLDREVGDLRRQLRDIRAAHEPLAKAIYPQSLGRKVVDPLTGDKWTFGGSGVAGPGPFPGANYFATTVATGPTYAEIMAQQSDLERRDNQDRLHHAGYPVYRGVA